MDGSEHESKSEHVTDFGSGKTPGDGCSARSGSSSTSHLKDNTPHDPSANETQQSRISPKPPGVICSAYFSVQPLGLILKTSTHELGQWLSNNITNSSIMPSEATEFWMPVPHNLMRFRMSPTHNYVILQFKTENDAFDFMTQIPNFKIGKQFYGEPRANIFIGVVTG